MEAPYYCNLIDRASLGNSFKYIPKPPTPQPNIMGLFLNLQDTVVKQQVLLKVLLQQQDRPHMPFNNQERRMPNPPAMFIPKEKMFNKLYRHVEAPLMRPQISQEFLVKEEASEKLRLNIIPALDGHMVAKRQSSLETSVSSDESLKKYTITSDYSVEKETSPSEEDAREWRETFSIRRRNGFKEKREQESPNLEDDHIREPRKSNKLIVPKKPPSKAKHLWINYGRKIIEFALNNTTDELQERIKLIVGKLGSKKDFEEFFRIRTDEPEAEKNFKMTFGKLALYFIKMHTETAFEGSKYKEQMIKQKSIVSTLISRLISGDF